MHHLFTRANAARLTVFLTATTLVFLALQLGEAPSRPASDAAAPLLVLTEGAPAAGARVPPHPLVLPGAFLERHTARRPGHRDARRPAHPKGARHSRSTSHQRRHSAQHSAQHATRTKRSHRHHPRHHPGQAGRRTTDRSGGRPKQVWGGRDISWPQCPPHVGIKELRGLAQPMPEPGVRFVIIGLTNGRAFTPNPCLRKHLRWVRKHHVWASAYAFTTYPTRGQLHRLGKRGPYERRSLHARLRNAGYAAARYNIRTMQRHGFVTPHVWLDVEESSSRPWSRRVDRNRAVVQGWVRAYRDAGYTVGFYSTINIWAEILGRTRFGLPEWRTAGPDTARAALGRCSERSFQGGPAVVAQWWNSRRDFDRMCPGYTHPEKMAKFFHQY